MRHGNKLLALLLALALCLALLPTPALAEGPDGDGGLISIVDAPEAPEEAAPAGQLPAEEASAGGPETVTTYGLKIAGVYVTSANREDVLGDGVFSFDGNRTLTVKGSCISEEGVIQNTGIQNLKIYVAAESMLKSTGAGSASISVKENTMITGSAKLSLLSSKDCAIYAENNATIRIQDATVSATGTWGISGRSSSSGEKLEIARATVSAWGENGAICDFGGGIKLEGCEIESPTNGRLSSSAVVDAAGSEVTYAKISPTYGIAINGVDITSSNREDVLGDGVFSFDGDHTLTVSGDCFTNSPREVVWNWGFDGLVIRIEKNAVLENTNGWTILVEEDTTITGSGKLKLSAPYDGAVYVENDAKLTIRDAVVDVFGDFGIVGGMGKEALVIDHATVKAGADKGAICGFGGVTLNNCSLVWPAGGRVSGGSVLDAGGFIAETAFIAVNPFVDVPENKYYFCPVMEAYYTDPQITSGTDATHFSPNAICTREQIVTFLWKGWDEPEPTGMSNPFTDVKAGKYYYKAVLWAVEEGITSGVSADKFGVGQACTREQAVTFLWKACGSPEPFSTANPFTDVKAGKYYYKAVLWAVEEGITSGVSADRFGVGQSCTRAQIVTFLYKTLWD